MSEVERIVDQLRRSFEGESWHGPAVLELLDGVSAPVAAYHPAPDVHSIEELVLHMATWKRAVTERIQGRPMAPTDAQDWPPVGGADAARWKETIAALERAHRELTDVARALADDGLGERPVDRVSRYGMLHGVVQHDLYHAGQIAILKKLARAASVDGRR